MTPLTSSITAFMAAVVFRNWRDPDAPRSDVTVRREIASIDWRTARPEGDVLREIDRLRAISPGDMPPDANDTARLLDTIAFRYGFETRADTWRAIGIHPDRGRDMLGRGKANMDWPVWFTMVAYALGDDYPLPIHINTKGANRADHERGQSEDP
jgi:hypothetical protein